MVDGCQLSCTAAITQGVHKPDINSRASLLPLR